MSIDRETIDDLEVGEWGWMTAKYANLDDGYIYTEWGLLPLNHPYLGMFKGNWGRESPKNRPPMRVTRIGKWRYEVMYGYFIDDEEAGRGMEWNTVRLWGHRVYMTYLILRAILFFLAVYIVFTYII